MATISLHDRETIAAFLRGRVERCIYEMGDLDDFFWPATTWYALEEGGRVRELALLYNAGDLPVLLAQASESADGARALLDGVRHLLPRRFYAHLTPGLAPALADAYQAEPHGPHDKMALAEPARLASYPTDSVVRLGDGDLAELLAFYAAAYPGNWFDPRMLATGHYYAFREGGQLLSVAGVHVYSPERRVAALGNITTRPDARGRGLAQIVIAHLCRELRRTVDHIGLNVLSDNAAAIACYRRVGFERVGSYEEWMFTR